MSLFTGKSSDQKLNDIFNKIEKKEDEFSIYGIIFKEEYDIFTCKRRFLRAIPHSLAVFMSKVFGSSDFNWTALNTTTVGKILFFIEKSKLNNRTVKM